MNKNIFIVGNLGSGKSTLVKKLQTENTESVVVSEEFLNNPFLQLFYKDMSRWGFSMQIKFLFDYLNSYNKIKNKTTTVITYLIDTGVWTNWKVFTKQLSDKKIISTDEYKLYEDLANQLVELYKYPQPDEIVYVTTPPEECLKRIKTRGLEFQKTISLEYLQELDAYFKQMIEFYKSKGVQITEVNNV